MKKNESAFIYIIVIGLILKLSLISLGYWVFLIGIGLLANSYFFGFSNILNNESYQEFVKNRVQLHLKKPYQSFPSFSIVILIIGMLFKFTAWPGGDTMILLGLVLLLVGMYFLLNNKTESKEWKIGAYKRMLIYGVIAIVFYFLPTFFWFEITNREHPEYIQATKDLYDDPSNQEYQLKLEEEIEKMENGV